MDTKSEISNAAAALGRRGGIAKTEVKRIASRNNGKLGGRPSLRQRAEERVNRSPLLSEYHDIIMYDWPDGNEHWKWVIHTHIDEIIDWAQTVEID